MGTIAAHRIHVWSIYLHVPIDIHHPWIGKHTVHPMDGMGPIVSSIFWKPLIASLVWSSSQDSLGSIGIEDLAPQHCSVAIAQIRCIPGSHGQEFRINLLGSMG